jgi:hypothetical protein
MVSIHADTVFQRAPWCVTREQEDQYLIYNVRTDEMHLVPPTGFYVYQLCDGLRSVGELEAQLAPAVDACEQEARVGIRTFVEQLVTRGILVDGGCHGGS